MKYFLIHLKFQRSKEKIMRQLYCALFMLAFIPVAVWADTLKVATDSPVASLDPYFHNETPTNSATYNIFDGLMNFDKDLNPYPVLAKSWRRLDDVTWQFILEKNVRFHNGNPFTADDVVYSIHRARHGKVSKFKSVVSAIERVEKVDDHTVNIKTFGPYPVLLRKLSYIRIMDKEYSQYLSDRDLGQLPVGTGPYRLESWYPGKVLRLKANHDYFRGKPAIDRVYIHPYPVDRTRATAIRANYVDLATRVPVTGVASIKSHPGQNFFTRPGLRLIFLQMDQHRDKSPYVQGVGTNPFKDVRVRKAFYLGIDEALIIKSVMNGFARPAGQFYPASVNGHDPATKRPGYDPQKARALLAQAGFNNGFTVVLDTPNDRYINDEKIARAVALCLSKIGITVKVNAMPKNKFFPKIVDADTSFYLMGWSCGDGDGSGFLDAAVHSFDDEKGFGTYNCGRYTNPEVDRLIESSAMVLDQKARQRILIKAMHKSLVEDQCLIPLHFQVDLYATKKNLVMSPRADTYLYFYDMKFMD